MKKKIIKKKKEKEKKKKKKRMVLSKQALNKRILALENIWITINNIFNCLFFMQEHKQQRNSILKLSITD